METVKTTKAPRTSRKKAAVKGASKKPRSQRPKLVLNDTKELVIVKAKMEQAEAAAPETKQRGRRKAQATQVLVKTMPATAGKAPYTGKPRGRKSNAVLAAEAALAATLAAPAPVKKAVSAAAPKATRKVNAKVKAKASAPVEAVVKRGPGRPAKAKAEVVAEVVAKAPTAKRGRKPKALMINNEAAPTTKLDDYALLHARTGSADYKELLRFMQEHSVPVKQAIGLLSGAVSVPTEEAIVAFKLGNFRIKNLAHAEHAAKLRNSMRKSAPNVYYKATFTNALARVSAMKGFSDKQLQKNMDKFFMGVEKADTVEGFERQILEIYNTNLPKKDRLALQAA
jgi:hypothetical protein